MLTCVLSGAGWLCSCSTAFSARWVQYLHECGCSKVYAVDPGKMEIDVGTLEHLQMQAQVCTN